MKQLLQSSKSSVASAIEAVGLKDLAKNTAKEAASAAIQSVIPKVTFSPPAPAPATRSTLQQGQVLPSTPTPPPPPYYYPPYYYQQQLSPLPPLPPVVPREPVYTSTKVGVSRVEKLSDNVYAADLHHVGKHPHPFYKQKWFIILIIILAVGILIGIVVGIYLYIRHKDNTDPNKDVPGIPAY